MFISFDADRPSSSPFIERVWSCHSTSGGNFLAKTLEGVWVGQSTPEEAMAKIQEHWQAALDKG